MHKAKIIHKNKIEQTYIDTSTKKQLTTCD